MDPSRSSERMSLALRQHLAAVSPKLLLDSSPFVLTFVAAAALAYTSLFPRLSGRQTAGARHDGSSTSSSALRLAGPSSSNSPPSPHRAPRPASLHGWARLVLDRAASITFAVTIALSAVLAELIFCEIANLADPTARKWVLERTVVALLSCLLVVAPALEIHSLVAATGLFASGGKRRLLLGLVLDAVGLTAWSVLFWKLGETVLFEARDAGGPLARTLADHARTLTRSSLERIGIIGVSLMASLAGFAAVSSIWQTFGAKARKVTDIHISRKQHGLDATADLLRAKQAQLDAFERKASALAGGGGGGGGVADMLPGGDKAATLFTRFVGSFRGGDADALETQALRLECAGLDSMVVSLSNELSVLRTRQAAQRRSATALGRALLATSHVFSLYCLYRIGATSTATLRRVASPSTSTFASTDPINNVLALVAKHWDPTIDRAAWSRQISFLLSGVMLLASFNAVWQTSLLFSRFVPASLQRSFADNLALLVSQISATYVVSSALLLRSNLPREMGKGIEGALGDPLDTAFVERWFEGWFLAVCFLTALGIWVGRTISGGGEWDDDALDDMGDVEMGWKKRTA